MEAIPLESLTFVRDLTIPGMRAALYRAVAQEHLVPVFRGAYAPAKLWRDATPEERHRAALRAAARLHPGAVFGGMSAALAWERPLVGPAPARPIVMARSGAARSTRSLRVLETMVDFAAVDLGDVSVTPLARALMDAARRVPTSMAVTALDHSLAAPIDGELHPLSARVTVAELAAELDIGTHVGRARAGFALQLANGLSGSPGESVSRVLLHLLDVPAPILQQAFLDDEGLIGFCDFAWPEFGVVGEFDGLGKYRSAQLRGDRSVEDVVVAEKLREDRLRALGLTVVRWGWAELHEPRRLAARLHAAGLPCNPSISALNFRPGK